ncbi:MAG: monovalent cation/H+ antiporter subunit D family protein [Myxococcota bacterium]|nr:monovalent cation/H+ antiporter subunit D family protein [Myxococcota bacterium]
MTDHLPALQTVVPLLAAPICILLRRASLVRAFAVSVTWSCLVIALLLLEQVMTRGTVSYALGGWAAPLGIEYRVDLLNAYVLVLVAAIGAVVVPFPLDPREVRIPRERLFLFYALFLLCLTGLLGITITGDLFNIFVFLEISSLAAYALIGLGSDRRALTAAFSYLVMGTVGGTFLLIGIGLVYQMTGTLNMVDLADRLPPVLGTRTVWMAFAFLVVGTSIKLAAFPLHQWLPNAYTFAPSMVSAFLSATATKVAYYVLVRIIFTVFGIVFVFERIGLSSLLMPLSLVAMGVGSLAAIYQMNIKRLLAYSSIAQIGYMTLGLSLANLDGLTGGLVHLFNHALIKGGLFLVVGCALLRVASPDVEALRGLGRRMPLTMAAFVVGGLSLIGVPGTVGFVSKWFLVLGALDQGLYVVAFLILASSLLAVVYVWRVVEVMYFGEPGVKVERHEAPLSMLLPTWVLIGATVYFGLDTQLTAGVARSAAEYLLGGTP